jgi:hypothetical protein
MARKSSHGNTASTQRIVKESSHSNTVSIQRLVRESSHGDTASVQWIVRESSHGNTVSIQQIVSLMATSRENVHIGVSNNHRVKVDRQCSSELESALRVDKHPCD